MELDYKQYTVQELIDALNYLSAQLPEKENTKITFGDSEGNYTYTKLKPMLDEENIFFEYEMHEKGANNIQKLIDSGEIKIL